MASQRSQNIITAYGDGYVSVNAVRYTQSLIVLPDQLVLDWTPPSFAALTRADFERLAALDAEVVLLGTGKAQRFPHPELLQPLMQARKGLEPMDLSAACRTYALLLNEGRQIAAALLFA